MAKSTTTQQRERWAASIQAARRRKNISQEELARLSGLSLSYIQKIENAMKGHQPTVAALLEVLAKAPKKKEAA